MWIETISQLCLVHDQVNSFASNGECGLKQAECISWPLAIDEFIRQQWRMWIETSLIHPPWNGKKKFIRQQWRMWIETGVRAQTAHHICNSFASNGECGLKRLRNPHG